MKNLRSTLRTLSFAVGTLLAIPSAQAAVATWNATGGNWSVGGNWDTLAAPTAVDDARFVNTGTGTPTIMNASRTINSLLYGHDDQALHTTTISPGQTLTINRADVGDVLYVGSTSVAITAGTLAPVTIDGTGGLSLNGTGNLVVRQGHSTAGAHRATLDLSGLDTLTANVGRLLVGQALTVGGAEVVARPTGTLILAKTNNITLTGTAPQVMIQDSQQNANGGTASVLTFGQVNNLFADSMRMGGQKGNANISFNAAFSTPSLQLRNADGASRVTLFAVGDNSFVNSGNSTVATMDLSAGTVDALLDTVYVARGNPGPNTGQATGTLTLGAGTFDVNTLEIGFQIATGANGAANGTLNVNNNSLFSTGAVLVVNNTLRLARTNGGTGAVNGTLNVSGGTVVANSIVAGGGNSTITLNAGSILTVSNSAGTLAAPIRNLGLTDATLNLPALNSGAVMAVSNLTVGGTQNLINISTIPPIASYPATFPLITYQTGAGGNFVRGSLPTASPSYAGTLVDSGNGVVSLQLTAGPVVDLSLRWTGATDGTWDSATLNWLYQGNPSTFFAGAAALLNDSTTQSNIQLAEALSPGSITVSNNLLQYTFTGGGNIAGAGTLIKRGSSNLTIANEGVNNIGNVVISAGTLQLGSGGVDGSISALNITNNGALIVNRSGSLSLSSPISGTGTLTKSGDGTLVLSGANSYNGATLLTGGALRVDGTSTGAGALTTSARTLLGGSGTVSGAVTVAGQLNPGPVNGPGVFKANGGLTLTAGSTLTFDLSATDPSNPVVNDSVEVIGNVAANNNVITVNISGTPQNGSSYLLFTYSGNLSGNFNPTIAGTHFPVTLNTSTPGSVFLNVTGDTGANLKWNSLADSAWDSVAANWLNLNSSSASQFFSGDSVLFDDEAGVVTAITIASGVNVSPSVITNSATNNNFTISGAGSISGSASIVKTGTGTLSLNTANSFTGTVEVRAGILQTGNGTALGSAATGTTVEPGGTLDLNGQSLGGEVLTVSGAGAGGVGAIINTGGAQNQALRTVVLTGDTAFGGTAQWSINNAGGGASLSTGGNPFKLTKVGANVVTLQNIAAVDPALGDIEVQQGTLEFNGLTASMGDPSRTNTVQTGATLQFGNGTAVWNKYFVLNGDGVATTVNNAAGANAELAGPVELHGNCIFNVGGTLMTISGLINGNGGLTKNGGSPLILTAENTYTGDTRINAAALRLSGTASISASPNVTIALGATLTVTGRVDSTFTLVNSQTLKGNGVINGHLIANAGSTAAPGIDAIGTLTISNTITLSGNTIMELDEANATNDLLRCNSSITYGGTLNLVNLGSPLSSGASFKLFNASSYPGSFSSINPPTPGPGQTWNTSALATSGTISVAGSPVAPQFGGVALSGNNLVLSGSNGAPSSTYYVLATTNIGLPLASWERIATNTFDGSGNFNFTNVITPAFPHRFFLIELP